MLIEEGWLPLRCKVSVFDVDKPLHILKATHFVANELQKQFHEATIARLQG